MAAKYLGAYSLFRRMKRRLGKDLKRAIRYHEFANDWKFLILVDAPQFIVVLTSVLIKKAASEAVFRECLQQNEWRSQQDLIKQCAFAPELVMLLKLTIICS